MKSYNFLKLGADMLGGMVAADEMEKKDKLMEWQRQERQSSIEANNALRDLRQKQAGQLDAKEAEVKAMQEAFAGIDIYDPRLVPLLIQHGDYDNAIKASNFQNKAKREALTTLGGGVDEILKLPPEQHADAAKRWIETQNKVMPSPIWDRLSGMTFTTDQLRQFGETAKTLLANEQRLVRLADGTLGWIGPGGMVGEPIGPKEPPKPQPGALTQKDIIDIERQKKKDAEDDEAKDQETYSARQQIQQLKQSKQWAPALNPAQVKLQTTADRPYKTKAYMDKERGTPAPANPAGGKVHKFANMAEAQAALKAGKIKKGDRFDIGGRTGVVQ